MEYYTNLVFLRISDAVAYSIKQKNLKKVSNEKQFRKNLQFYLLIDLKLDFWEQTLQ